MSHAHRVAAATAVAACSDHQLNSQVQMLLKTIHLFIFFFCFLLLLLFFILEVGKILIFCIKLRHLPSPLCLAICSQPVNIFTVLIVSKCLHRSLMLHSKDNPGGREKDVALEMF